MLLFSSEENIKEILSGSNNHQCFYFSVDNIVKSGQSNEINWAVVLRGTVYYTKMLR